MLNCCVVQIQDRGNVTAKPVLVLPECCLQTSHHISCW